MVGGWVGAWIAHQLAVWFVGWLELSPPARPHPGFISLSSGFLEGASHAMPFLRCPCVIWTVVGGWMGGCLAGERISWPVDGLVGWSHPLPPAFILALSACFLRRESHYALLTLPVCNMDGCWWVDGWLAGWVFGWRADQLAGWWVGWLETSPPARLHPGFISLFSEARVTLCPSYAARV